MKKNILPATFNVIQFLLIVTFITKTSETRAQYNCIDYAKHQYPKTVNGKSYEWNAAAWNFVDIQQHKPVSGLNIGSQGFFHGLLEHLPPSYATNTTAKYPVIIYFHGNASNGTGTAQEMCKMFKDLGSDLATHLSIPGRVERESEIFNSREFIVICPQNKEYRRLHATLPDHFPSFNEVEKVIEYVEANYRIDPRRIYLTGLSTGANMIMEYVGSSLARAKKVAAVLPISLCSQLYHVNNTSRGIDATYIGQAKLKTWFIYCPTDNCTGASATNVSQEWVDVIKSVPGHAPPRFTKLKPVSNPADHNLYDCSDTLLHDAWSRAYNPEFVASFENGNGANDGINKNAYDWFLDARTAVAPPVPVKKLAVTLKDYKVDVSWVTTDEIENTSFAVERAASDQLFIEIANLPALKNHLGNRKYTFTDHSPLDELSFYRIVHTDIDGNKNYYEIKSVVNQKNPHNTILTYPNPFTSEVSAFVTNDKSQKLVITLTDMNGRVLKSISGLYGAGSTEVKLKSHDLAKGIYLLKVKGESVNALKKIIRK